MQIILSSLERVVIPDNSLIIDSTSFTWDHASFEFTADASMLEYEMNRQARSRLGYINGEWGFVMRSHRTGRNVWFNRVREFKNLDNELMYVEFACAEIPGIKLKVFND